MSKRSSFFVPDDDSDSDEQDNSEENPPVTLDVKKLLQDISKDVRKAVQDALESVQTSIEFVSDQVLTLDKTIQNQDEKIKALERKNIDLTNKNKNSDLRIAALEQQILEIDQKSMATFLEISGLPDTPKQDVQTAVKAVASKLEVSDEDVLDIRQLSRHRKEQPVTLVLEMKTKSSRNEWISTGKSLQLTAGDVVSGVPQDLATNRIYIREALTQQTKALLYEAKQRLRASYQFIWCKYGRIYVKKDAGKDTKVSIVRNKQDIELLAESSG